MRRWTYSTLLIVMANVALQAAESEAQASTNLTSTPPPTSAQAIQGNRDTGQESESLSDRLPVYLGIGLGMLFVAFVCFQLGKSGPSSRAIGPVPGMEVKPQSFVPQQQGGWPQQSQNYSQYSYQQQTLQSRVPRPWSFFQNQGQARMSMFNLGQKSTISSTGSSEVSSMSSWSGYSGSQGYPQQQQSGVASGYQGSPYAGAGAGAGGAAGGFDRLKSKWYAGLRRFTFRPVSNGVGIRQNIPEV